MRYQLIYYPTVTRDCFCNRGQATDLIVSGKLFAEIELPELEPQHDRIMICGSPGLVRDPRELLVAKGCRWGSRQAGAIRVRKRVRRTK